MKNRVAIFCFEPLQLTPCRFAMAMSPSCVAASLAKVCRDLSWSALVDGDGDSTASLSFPGAAVDDPVGVEAVRLVELTALLVELTALLVVGLVTEVGGLSRDLDAAVLFAVGVALRFAAIEISLAVFRFGCGKIPADCMSFEDDAIRAFFCPGLGGVDGGLVSKRVLGVFCHSRVEFL